MKTVYVSKEEYKIIADILQNVPYQVLVFGSRIKGTHQAFSDIDICLKSNSPIELSEMAELKNQFRESNLPFTVDLIAYDELSDSFKVHIDQEGIHFNALAPIMQSPYAGHIA